MLSAISPRALQPPEDESPFEHGLQPTWQDAVRIINDQADQQNQANMKLKKQNTIYKVLLLGQVRP